jgi:spermidine/putrescine transport system permease protein
MISFSRYYNYISFASGALAFVWQALFFYVPLIFVLIAGFSGETWYTGFIPFFNHAYLTILARSVVMALGTSLICFIIGYPLAYFIVFRAESMRNFLLFLIMLPFWTNFLLHICAWFFVLDYQGFMNSALVKLGIIDQPLHILNTYWAIGIVMVYFYLPFMILPLYAALDRFDKRLLEASLDLGASWQQTVVRVLIPLTMSGIRVGFLLVCIPAFGEFVIPYFMGGDRTMFVGSVITHFILKTESGVEGSAFTLLSSLVLIALAGSVYSAFGQLMPRSSEERL